MICLDTNVVYHFLFETELTSAFREGYQGGSYRGTALPMIVYNELLYTTGANTA